MGETILIAIVGAGSALAGALVTQWFEMQREERRARGDERHLRETHDNERRVRVETFIREQRAKQADRIRDWIERQLIASVDIEHLMAAAQVQGDPIAQGASLAAASALLATRASSDGRSVSVNAALSGVTDGEIVHDVRRLAEQNLKFRRHLEPLRDFLTANPMPWGEIQIEELNTVGKELRRFQEDFDDQLVEVYREIDRYCALTE